MTQRIIITSEVYVYHDRECESIWFTPTGVVKTTGIRGDLYPTIVFSKTRGIREVPRTKFGIGDVLILEGPFAGGWTSLEFNEFRTLSPLEQLAEAAE